MATKKQSTKRREARNSRASAGSTANLVFESGTGNVFADIGVADADERLAKAELARIIRTLVSEQVSEGSTQGRLARQLGLAAPDMSDLMRGKLTRFSRERLETLVVRLGMAVHIVVSAPTKARAGLTVELVEGAA